MTQAITTWHVPAVMVVQGSSRRARGGSPSGVPALLQQRWVQAVVVLAAAFWVHKRWRRSQFNNKPLPDAWYRAADEHRRCGEGAAGFFLFTCCCQGVGLCLLLCDF